MGPGRARSRAPVITGVFALFVFGILWKKEAMKTTQGNVRLGFLALGCQRPHAPLRQAPAPRHFGVGRWAQGSAPTYCPMGPKGTAWVRFWALCGPGTHLLLVLLLGPSRPRPWPGRPKVAI